MSRALLPSTPDPTPLTTSLQSSLPLLERPTTAIQPTITANDSECLLEDPANPNNPPRSPATSIGTGCPRRTSLPSSSYVNQRTRIESRPSTETERATTIIFRGEYNTRGRMLCWSRRERRDERERSSFACRKSAGSWKESSIVKDSNYGWIPRGLEDSLVCPVRSGRNGVPGTSRSSYGVTLTKKAPNAVTVGSRTPWIHTRGAVCGKERSSSPPATQNHAARIRIQTRRSQNPLHQPFTPTNRRLAFRLWIPESRPIDPSCANGWNHSQRAVQRKQRGLWLAVECRH